MFRRIQLLAITAFALMDHSTASAQTYTWTGASGLVGLWDLSGNWSGGVPTTGGVALFNTATPFQSVILGDTSPIDTLRFSSGSASYSLLSGNLNLQGNNLIEVTAGTTADQLILSQVNLGGSGTFRNNGTGLLTLFDVLTPNTLSVEGSGNTLVSGTISGNGALAAKGAGILTLTGTNTFLGGTSVFSGATLQLGDGTNTGTVAGNINVEGTLAFNPGASGQTFGGTISGTGATVTKSGTNTLTLTGTNSYTGGTTVSGGVLSIDTLADLGVNSSVGTGALSLDSSHDITLRYTGGTVSVNRGLSISGGGIVDVTTADTTLTLTGTVSGIGRLTKSGAGTLVLANAGTALNTGFVVETGTLRAGVAGGLQSNETYQVNGGTLDLNGFDLTAVNLFGTGGTIALGSATLTTTFTGPGHVTYSFAGAITGTGGLTKQSSHLLTLTGANTYTGTTTISGGTLQVGNGGTTGSIVGDVTNSGTLAFNRSDDLTFTGAISGSGSLTKSGAGTLTFTGHNTYAGGTTVSAGTLQVGNGGTTGSITGDVTNDGTLAFNRSDDLTFGGTISGTGNLTKLGAGTLTLTGNSSYTGVTTLREGVVSVSTLSSFGVDSPIGAANNEIDKLVFDGGTLRFVSSTLTTISRRFTVGPNGGTLAVAGTAGGLRIGGDSVITPSGTGARTFTLDVAAGRTAEIRSDYFYEVGDTSTGVTKTGTGSATLSGFYLWTNTGPIQVNEGQLTFRARSMNGSSGVTAPVTVASGATLVVNGDGGFNQLRIGSLAGAGTVQSFSDGSAHLLTVGGNNGSTEFSGLLRDGNTANGSIANVAKVGTGTWTLTGTNTYTGYTQITGNGVLSVSSLADGGVASGIGESSNAAINLILGGFGSGTLRYTGTGASTDRLFQLQSGGGTLDASGTGLLSFTNTGNVSFGSGSQPLTLTGTGNGLLAPVLGNAASLTKSGPGTWTLSGSNTYTGATTITDGTLAVNGSLAAGSAVTVSGGTLGGSGTVNGAVTVNSGATITPGSSIGTLTVGSVQFRDGSQLGIEIGSIDPLDADKLNVFGLATSQTTGDMITVKLSGNVTSYLAGTPVTYTILESDSSSTLTNANFSLNTTGFTSNLAGTWTHTFSNGNLNVTFTPVPEPTTVFGLGVLALGATRWIRRR